MNGIFKNSLVTVAVTVLCFLSVTYTACKKENTSPVADECENVQCQNGGSCFKGMCSCLSGFEGRTCEVNTIERYSGMWKIKEKIVSSSKDGNENIIREYNWTIKAKPDTRTEFLIDDFMGNTAYDNVWCTEARNEKYELSPYTSFAFERPQGIGNGNVYIAWGGGSVNDLGTAMTGVYVATYAADTVLVSDTVSFTADRVQ